MMKALSLTHLRAIFPINNMIQDLAGWHLSHMEQVELAYSHL